jgi:hypothetical protein
MFCRKEGWENMTIDVHFNDSGREPTCKPNPKYPDGMHISLAEPGVKSCTSNLPWPAPRCGTYSIVCRTCHFTALITVAGRADDPKIVTLPCKGFQH